MPNSVGHNIYHYQCSFWVCMVSWIQYNLYDKLQIAEIRTEQFSPVPLSETPQCWCMCHIASASNQAALVSLREILPVRGWRNLQRFFQHMLSPKWQEAPGRYAALVAHQSTRILGPHPSPHLHPWKQLTTHLSAPTCEQVTKVWFHFWLRVTYNMAKGLHHETVKALETHPKAILWTMSYARFGSVKISWVLC